jgi:hypothetical protein
MTVRLYVIIFLCELIFVGSFDNQIVIVFSFAYICLRRFLPHNS